MSYLTVFNEFLSGSNATLSLIFLAILGIAVIAYIAFLLHHGTRVIEGSKGKLQQGQDTSVQGNHEAGLALEQAQHVLNTAVTKAQHMLEQTDLFQRSLEHESRELFLTTSKRYMEMFEKNLAALDGSYKQSLQKVQVESLENLKKMMETQKIGAQQALRERVNEEFDRARAEVDEYKKYKIQSATQHIDMVVSQITKDVVASSLSRADQKELIFRSLEKAKIDGIFGANGEVDKQQKKPTSNVTAQNGQAPQPVPATN